MKSSPRHIALDYFRSLALALIIAIHFMRGFVGDDPGSWGETALFIAESAHVFFFIAFGMTLMRNLQRGEKLRLIYEFGIIALFHQVYRDSVLSFECDFFLFLWFALIISIVFHKLFENRWIRLILATAIIIANILIGHVNLGILGVHPFGLMPWLFFVIVGMMLGAKPIDKPNQTKITVYALALFVIGLSLNLYGLRYGIHFLRATISKWEPTTSAYMLIWTSIALCTYVLFNRIKFNPESKPKKIITVSSKLFIAGALIQYVIIDFATYVLNTGGYGLDNYLPAYLAVLFTAALLAFVYIILLILGDARQIVISYLGDEKKLYQIGWNVLIILAFTALIITFQNSESTALPTIAKAGMFIAAFVFLKSDYTMESKN